MPHTAPGRVYQLRLEPPPMESLLETRHDHIERSISAGRSTTRYGREWIIGKTEVRGTILSGRIGFRGESGTAEVWDDELQDFRETAVPQGLAAPFAIDTDSLRAVIQARPPLLRVPGMIGALEALLTQDQQRWRIVGLRTPMSLSEWKKSVTKVTMVRFAIREPNPHYFGAKNLEQMMTEFNSEVIQLEARNETAGVNMDAPFIQETESHVVDRGYGEAEYRGLLPAEDGEVRASTYNTAVGAEENTQPVEVNAESGEVSGTALRGLLTQAPAEPLFFEPGDVAEQPAIEGDGSDRAGDG